MKRIWRAAVLCALLLTGCGEAVPETTEQTEAAAAAMADVSGPDSDIDPGCLQTVVAQVGNAELTNAELQIWYGAEVAQYRQEGLTPAPDFSRPLEEQFREGAENGDSWQQYFLGCALQRWHTAQALVCHAEENPLPLEEAYKGNPDMLDKYMAGMPVTDILYGYNAFYSPNSLHQKYLDSLEETLSGETLEMARVLNLGYMYFTTLSYELEKMPVAQEEPVASFRQILLLPEDGETLGECMLRGEQLLDTWKKDRKCGESTFAQLASEHSRDTGSVGHGGLYQNLRRDQMPYWLSGWCFGETRQEGDTSVFTTDYGVHILYYVNAGDVTDSGRQAQTLLLEEIRQMYPIAVDYDSIVLGKTGETPAVSELLYPDVAHERFPEVPVYLQQNYLGTMYGDFKLTTNGCGITSLAMIASYMADDELTPPELAARYGRYSRSNGTAASLFEDAPPQLGFYLLKKTYDWKEAREYIQQGYAAVTCQHKGYWTSGGHYLVLEKMTEEGLVQVRDSNMVNYRRLSRHQEDAFPWDTLSPHGQGYWIFEKKAVTCEACSRCGNPQTLEWPVVTDYLCEKCTTALARRGSYLAVQ